MRDDWLSRGAFVAAVRVAHAAFFVAVAAYCFLSYSPFAYAQFIKPRVVPALADFVQISQWYCCAIILATILTLMPQLRGGRGRALALGYTVAWGAAAVLALYVKPLRTIGNSRTGFVIGLLSLIAPIWVAAIDHRSRRLPEVLPVPLRRLVSTCVIAAICGWACYALAVPFQLAKMPDLALGTGELALSMSSSLVVDLYAVTVVCLAMATIVACVRWFAAPARFEFGLFVALLGVAAALVLYWLVCASIAFVGIEAGIASSALGLTLAVVWADVARLRAPADRPIDSLALFGAPIAGRRPVRAATVGLTALPVVAYALVTAVLHLDWNFLLQKLTVLLVWLAVFSLCAAIVNGAQMAGVARRRQEFAALLVFGLYHGFVSIEGRHAGAVVKYAALDPSYRLMRDARVSRSSETAEYYAFLHSQTLVARADVPPLDVDFVKPLHPAAGSLPDIYLFVVDSLRRDYLSPYNPRVTFTPSIERLARESYVFERAFTRYAGTALAAPSIWAGGMVPHALEQTAFPRRNTLLKLLDANRYTRMMDLDHIISELVAPDDNLVQLDKGKGTMNLDLCGTLGELERRVDAADRSRPVFFYALPQNVHIAVAYSRKVPPEETYPGFFAPVASSVHRIDACLGGFVDFLKRTDRYDNSIVILTSDHGDSLGEEGRWGHQLFIVPEIARIPLIMHVPSPLTEHMAVDLSAVAFSSDIVPSLYALLGYTAEPAGRFSGRPVFSRSDADSLWRRRGAFLLASSYGASYGMLDRNGTRMYVVNAVDGDDSAFDLAGDEAGRRLHITETMTRENRARIREQLLDLARENHYRQGASAP